MTSRPGKIGVAVVGLGIGEQHARAYLRTGSCELRWLYDLDLEKARRLTGEFERGKVAEDYRAILQDPEVQIVSIASYDDAHFEQVVEALKVGKSVFVEKPLCRTVEELRIIKRAWAKQHGKAKLYSNLVLRAAPVYRHLKQLIEAGELGEIYSLDADYLYGRLDKIAHGWRKDVVNYSVILGGGVHLVDLMLWLTGERPVKVLALGNRICSQGTDFRYLDNVEAMLQADNGMIGRITANFGCVHPHQHVIRVFGTKGTFIYDDQGPRLQMSRDPESSAMVMSLATLPATKGDLIPNFVKSVMLDKSMEAETEHEFDVISVCAAIDQALMAGKALKVEYV